MKIFGNRIIFNFCTLRKSKYNNRSIKNFFISGFKVNNIAFGFSQENISSRQIDLKINQQKWKNLQNNFKSLKTSFGLIVPTEISKDYSKPEIIQFTLESLRQCSNKHPQYLHEELKKADSKFYRVIDATLGNLWKAQKKQALQFMSFIFHWGIHLRNDQIGEIILRTIKKMQLTLFEIFELLKTIFKLCQKQTHLQGINKQEKLSQQSKMQKNTQNYNMILNMDEILRRLLVLCENKILMRLQVMNPQQYEALFKIINMFRHYDIYPQAKSQSKNQQQQQMNFFDIIQRNIFRNLTEIPPSSLVIMAVHYANNTKQDQDQRINILQKLQQRIIFNLKFFNHQQLIAILYCYLRSSMLSQKFRQQSVARIRLIYHQLSWTNKKKILAISSNFPQHQKILIISESQSQLLKGKPIVTKLNDGSIKKQYDPKVFIEPDYQLVPEIYLASYENNLLTEELCKRMQNIILQNIYNYDREEVVRSVWLFTVTPSIGDNLERLHKKLQVIIEGGFQGGQYSIKDISIIVWSLCNSGSRNQNIYKAESEFWNNIEFYLQQKLQKSTETQNKLSDISSILWAYTFNRPLKFKTVSLITDILLQEMQGAQKQGSNSLQTFQLINIITFYYSLPKKSLPQSLLNKMKEVCLRYFEQMYLQMNSLQLMKCLKYLTVQEREENKLVLKLKVWENIIGTFSMELNEIEYEQIMGVVGLVVDSPLGRARDRKVIDLVAKLMKRKKSLQQLKSVEENEQKSKFK